MKAITLHQPWATLIMLGIKTYETRSWQTSHRGPIAIHAGALLSAEYRQLCATDPHISATLAAHGLTYDTLPYGSVLGTCQVGEVYHTEDLRELSETERACGDYTPGRYAWSLYDVQALVRPVRCRGFQQLWTVPAEKLPLLLTRLAIARALQARFGGLVQAEDILHLHRTTEPANAYETFDVQATREARTDWYHLQVSSAGDIDHTTIEQLPF